MLNEATSDDQALEAFLALPQDEQVLHLRAASARGDDLQAVVDYAWVVFGVEATRHEKEWWQAIIENKRGVIVAPPESAKTTAVSIIMLSWWIGKHPWTTNLVVSSGEALAGKIAAKIAQTIEFNPRWRLVFPYVQPNYKAGWSSEGYEVIDVSLPADEWQRLTARKKDPSLSFGGVGSSSVNGKRIDGLCIADDVHDRESKSSEAKCSQTVDFVKDTLIPRVTEEGRFWMIQTRWNRKDSVNYLIGIELDGQKMYLYFHHLPIVTNDQGEEESYWPEVWPMERMRRRRAEMTEREWQLVYMGNAEAAEGEILKYEYLHHFPYLKIPEKCERFIGVDYARSLSALLGSKNSDPDHYSLAVLAYVDALLVLEDGYDGVLSPGDTEEKFWEFVDRYRPRRAQIETNASGANYYRDLLRRKMERGYTWLTLLNDTTSANKVDKIEGMAPDFKSGFILVSDADTPFLRRFEDCWTGFGKKGRKDDPLDAVYNARQAAYWLLPSGPGGGRQKVETPPIMQAMKQIESAYQRKRSRR